MNVTEKINEVISLMDIPNVDRKPETAINGMKSLNILVEIRGEIEQRLEAGQHQTVVIGTPIVTEAFTDNGEHSHWRLIDSENGNLLWSEFPEEDKILYTK